MVRFCAVRNCGKIPSRRSRHRLPFHSPELLRLWLSLLGLDRNTPVEVLREADHRVCALHFRYEDYVQSTGSRNRKTSPKKLYLKRTAVPTLDGEDLGISSMSAVEVTLDEDDVTLDEDDVTLDAPCNIHIKLENRGPTLDDEDLGTSSMSADDVTLALLQDARETVRSSPLGVINTPLIPWSQSALPLPAACNIHIKLENMQRTGSFKIRGVANQFARRPKGGHFVTMSAGNYGKSFAYACRHYGSKGKVVMPETAPLARSALIESLGLDVERVPTSRLMEAVNRCVLEENMTFLHSYDDMDLIAGHASLGLEVLEVIAEPDVVVVSCGGGGLLAGVAAAIKLSGCHDTRIYGVEPQGACTMHQSFIAKKPVAMDTKSIASGLAPPSAGSLPYALCQRYVEEIVLVSDEEIKAAVSYLYRAGLVVEPSGAAAIAAIANQRIPKLAGKTVVAIVSGGNIGKDELSNFPD